MSEQQIRTMEKLQQAIPKMSEYEIGYMDGMVAGAINSKRANDVAGEEGERDE